MESLLKLVFARFASFFFPFVFLVIHQKYTWGWECSPVRRVPVRSDEALDFILIAVVHACNPGMWELEGT